MREVQGWKMAGNNPPHLACSSLAYKIFADHFHHKDVFYVFTHF